MRAAAAVEADGGAGPVRFPIKGDGRQTRAFIHVDDFTDGLVRVVENGQHLNVYHIGNPDEVSVEALASLIFKEFGREPAFAFEPAPAGETRRRCPDISKLRGLGFAPKIPLVQGLPAVVRWYRENRELAEARVRKVRDVDVRVPVPRDSGMPDLRLAEDALAAVPRLRAAGQHHAAGRRAGRGAGDVSAGDVSLRGLRTGADRARSFAGGAVSLLLSVSQRHHEDPARELRRSLSGVVAEAWAAARATSSSTSARTTARC